MAAINRTITIPDNGTESEVVEALAHAPAVSILIIAPPTLSQTVKIQVCDTPDGTFVDLQSGAVDITIPANKGTALTIVPGAYWKLKAGGAVRGDEIFRVIVVRIGIPQIM